MHERRGSNDAAYEDDVFANLLEKDVGHLRSTLCRVLNSGYFGLVMFIVVMANLALAVMETDYRAANQLDESDSLPILFRVTSAIFLLVYMTEISVRIYVYRWAFPRSCLNIFDGCIVVIEALHATVLMEIVMPSAGPLRMFRLVRLFRAVRVFRQFRELYLIVYGLSRAFKAICWASLLLVVILTLWAIIAVEILHPINVLVTKDGHYEGSCDRCPRAFESVFDSLLTFTQQIVAGDSWGLVSVPIIERQPSSALVFLAVIISVQLGLMNLVLTVIVDAATEARDHDLRMQMQEKADVYKMAKSTLTKLCTEMDLNVNGSLTLDEVMKAYTNNEEFRMIMNMMDLKKDDLPLVFDILDMDKSGDVSPGEFVEQIYKMKSQDLHTLIVFIRHYVLEVKADVRDALRFLKKDARLSLRTSTHGESESLDNTDAVPNLADPFVSTLAPVMSSSATPTVLGKVTYMDPVPEEEALPPHQRPPPGMPPPQPPLLLGAPAAGPPTAKDQDRWWLDGSRGHDSDAALGELASILAEARRGFQDQDQLFARGSVLLDQFTAAGMNSKRSRSARENFLHTEPPQRPAFETRSASQTPNLSQWRQQQPPSQAPKAAVGSALAAAAQAPGRQG